MMENLLKKFEKEFLKNTLKVLKLVKEKVMIFYVKLMLLKISILKIMFLLIRV